MNFYVFVGTICAVGETEFDQLGQRAQFSDEQAHEVIRGGGAFLPQEEFDALGFTEEEVRQFGNAGGFPEPTAEFAAKRAKAHDRVRELMAQYHEDHAKSVDSK